MEGDYPGPERVLGISEGAVRRDAELRSTDPTPVRLRLAVRGCCDIVGVALGTVNAFRPSLSDEPGFR